MHPGFYSSDVFGQAGEGGCSGGVNVRSVVMVEQSMLVDDVTKGKHGEDE